MVAPVETVEETAGYAEYVRWCGRTGAAKPPPTRLANAGKPLGIALIWPVRVSTVAVVAFVVDDEDVAPLGFAVRNSLDHLGRRFDPGIQLFWRGRTRAAVDDELPLVAGPESQGSGIKLVVVGYLDTGAGQRRFPQVSGWNEVEGLPVIVGVAGVQGNCSDLMR